MAWNDLHAKRFTEMKKNILKIPEGGQFSNRQLFGIYLPVYSENLLICLLGIVDTWLASRLNDSATAGVSYVITVDSIMKSFLSGMTGGGSVLIAQWIGKKDYPKANLAARASLLTTGSVALFFTLLLSVDPSEAICLMVGRPDPETLDYATAYFRISVLSYPIYALNYACNAAYRSQGNTKKPMFGSVVTLLVSLASKYFFVSVMDLGTASYSLANCAGITVSTLLLLPGLLRKGYPVTFRREGEAFMTRRMLTGNLRMSIPNALESAMFQLGLLFVQRFVVSYGVIHSAANGIGKQLQPFNYLVASCWGTVCLVVVGQYVGAGQREMAVSYAKHIMKLSYLCHLVITLPCILGCRLLVSAFGGSEETLELTRQLFLLYSYAALPLYTPAWVLPNVLRAGGDVNYTMALSIVTMFALRVGVAYIFGTILGLGVIGVWIAMVIDWAARAVIFVLRYRSGKWFRNQTE